MLYAYGKLGRVIALRQDRWGYVGGDNEPPRLLRHLAERNPDDTWVIVSPCFDDPAECGFPPNVVNMWTPERREWLRERLSETKERWKHASTPAEKLDRARAIMDVHLPLYLPLAEKLDGVVMWIGQHGPVNSAVRAVAVSRSSGGEYARPYDSYLHYAGPLIRLINAWRDRDPLENEEVWLIADNRNYLKARDVKWPSRFPLLGQYTTTRSSQHERFDDARDPEEHGFTDARWATSHTWRSSYRYVYSRLEVCGILPDNSPLETADEFARRDLVDEWETRRRFGLFINEAGSLGDKNLARAHVLREWVLPLEPDFVHGQWPPGHEERVGRRIEPVDWDDYYPTLRSVKTTFTTPSSCSGWATTKPWEAFGAGTVCLRHPAYDDQDNVYGEFAADVQEWLCPRTPAELAARVDALDRDRVTWLRLVRAQRALYDRAVTELRHVTLIEDRLKRRTTV